jgi:hypothetical protein
VTALHKNSKREEGFFDGSMIFSDKPSESEDTFQIADLPQSWNRRIGISVGQEW